jgi:hypothetical protein
MRSLPEFTNAVRLTTGPRADVRGPGVKSAVTFAWMCAGDGGGGRAREGADEAMRRRVLRAPSVAPATANGFQRFTFVFALTNGYEATDVARRCDARDVTVAMDARGRSVAPRSTKPSTDQYSQALDEQPLA